ncbi:MAG: hypothetical protein FJW37_15210, partial [Acidobacteria bacterium]|nr:hypothetical protein [Acidobacteriota bacterium]
MERQILQAVPNPAPAPAPAPKPGLFDRVRAILKWARSVLADPGWVAGLAWAIATTLLLFLNNAWFAMPPFGSLKEVMAELGVAGLACGIVLLVAGYLKHYERDVARSPRHLYLVAIVAMCYLAFLLLLRTFMVPVAVNPVPALGMLLAVFVNWRVAMAVTLAVALPLALMPWQGHAYTLVGIAGAWVAIVSVRRIRERWDVGKAGILAGIAMAAGLAIAGPLSPTWELESWLRNIGLAALSGPISAVLVMGVLPYLERLTGITTAFTLLELANPAQELLRHLLLKAPGTYHHSILVGNLGEAAAEAIG